MKKIVFIIAVMLHSTFGISQNIKISNVISENKITSFSEQKLILIDFWATWCAPCVYATKQLEILQTSNKEKVFVISISDENESKIIKYLEKKPIELMVTSDFDSYTFDKYNVTSRPYAVLLDLKGKLLWEGNPSNLTQNQINEFYKQQSKIKTTQKFEDFVEILNENLSSNKMLSNNKEMMLSDLNTDENEISETDDEVFFKGSISDLFFTLKKIHPYEINFSENTNKRINLIVSKDYWNNQQDKLIDDVMSFYNFKRNSKETKLEGIEIIVEDSKLLWNSNQFDWENNPINYIIGNDRIQADNMTLNSISILLSKTTQKNYLYKGKDTNLYDWDFQYLYEELMEEELSTSFGIKLKPTKIVTNVTYISN